MIGRERFANRPPKPKPPPEAPKTPSAAVSEVQPAQPPPKAPEAVKSDSGGIQGHMQQPGAGKRARKARQQARQRQKQQERLDSRLPHGAEFGMQYDAAKTLWTGTLTVPHPVTGAPETFRADASALFTLCIRLDRQYRAFLARQEQPPQLPQQEVQP